MADLMGMLELSKLVAKRMLTCRKGNRNTDSKPHGLCLQCLLPTIKSHSQDEAR